MQGWEGYVRMGKGCVRCVRRGEVQGGGGGMEGERECVRGGGVCKRGRGCEMKGVEYERLGWVCKGGEGVQGRVGSCKGGGDV